MGKRTRWQDRARHAAPALVLAFLAPLMAEILPGATRFQALFVFPIELAVWGGGAVLIRAYVRSRGLPWTSLLLLALALATAEEFLIQQTSLAPLVVKLQGEVWGRAFDVNYVYLIWALMYESVWVVLLPIVATELMFPDRRREPWIGRKGAVVVAALFLIGAGLAWFTWTRMARVHAFQQPLYDPSIGYLAAGTLLVLGLALVASRQKAPVRRAWSPPALWLVATLGAVWAVCWYALLLFAFGIAPRLHPGIAAASGVAVAASVLACLPRWMSHSGWRDVHSFALLAGCLAGSMFVTFVGFIGSDPVDLIFKIAIDIAGAIWLIWLGLSVAERDYMSPADVAVSRR